MKILHTGDWHIDENNSHNQECIDYTVNKAIEEKPDYVVLAGDIFDSAGTKSTRGFGELLYLKSKLNLLSDNKLKTIVLYGTPNHDNRIAFVELLETYKDNEFITIVTENQIVTIDDVDFVCATGDYNQFDVDTSLSFAEQNQQKTLQLNKNISEMYDRCTSDSKVLVSHFTCNNGTNDIFEDVMIDIRQMSKKFDLIILGHIHKPQKITHNAFYCGSIDATSFNDVADEKGFWFHTLENKVLVNSEFVNTPYKNHIVIDLTADDIQNLNNGDFSVFDNYDLDNCKVRLDFQDELNNIVEVEKYILKKGSDNVHIKKSIKQEEKNVTISEDDDPLTVLEYYLANKYLKEDVDIQELVALAKPIVDKFYENNTTRLSSGEFTPLSIHLKNYRSHKDTFVDFSKFNSVLLNGSNGSGKSSIVESISTCLYENTREGNIQTWIANNATSGSIEFIFSISNQQYKIIRSRSKTRGSLKLYKFDNDTNEFIDISKDKIADTQNTIIDLIGMDCQTFKSCCFIAQDEYDVFLKATSDERIAMLTSLLGLSMYEDMEQSVKEIITLLNKDIKNYVSEINNISDELDIVGNPISELQNSENDIKELQKNITDLELKIQQLDKSKKDFDSLNFKLDLKNKSYMEYENDINALKSKLDKFVDIESKILELPVLKQEYNILNNKIKELEVEFDNYSKLESDKATVLTKLDNDRKELENTSLEIGKVEKHLDKEDELKNSLQEYIVNEDKELLEENINKCIETNDELDKKQKEFTELKYEIQSKQNKFNTDLTICQSEQNRLKELKRQQENVGCINITEAKCSFIQSASFVEEHLVIQQQNELDIFEHIKKVSEELEKVDADLKELSETKISNSSLLKEYQTLEKDITTKESKYIDVKNQLDKISIYRDNFNLLNSKKVELETLVNNGENTVKDIDLKIQQQDSFVSNYNDVKEQFTKLENSIKELEKLEIELQNKTEVSEQLSSKQSSQSIALDEINDIKSDLQTIKNSTLDVNFENIESLLNVIRKEIEQNKNNLNSQLIQKGKLEERVVKFNELNEKLEKTNSIHRQSVSNLQNYKILQESFNYNGIPHSIIKNVVPFIKTNANNVITTMTNGKMEILFIEDKVQKNKKEVPVLDIQLKQGKSILPYESLSGGEKVRVSLAIALALVEMKINKTGVKLGMLIIDEPSFLDDNGITAYCDSLDMVKEKYPTIKLIAVTHLDLMKSRFANVINVKKNIDGESIIK